MKNKTTKKDLPAILGGSPVRKKPLPQVHNIGADEIRAATRVLTRGPLSGFLGLAGNGFLGGPEVLRLENKFAHVFNVAYAVSCNSATSGLHMAIVALGIGPGDEVIVTPYSMSASATAILMNGAVPVFADIDERTFCLDPKSVEVKITPRTKAIMVVNLFGRPADFGSLLKIAKKYKLKVIEDNAQAPGATWRTKYAGTIGDIGVFSFNVHKTIQAGEGGMLVTNNKEYALRAQLSRNHGEVVVDGMPNYTAGPIIGGNYRMTEVVAAIANEQLRKLNSFNLQRIKLAQYLTKQLLAIDGIVLPTQDTRDCNVYYVYPFLIKEKVLGISRDLLVAAMAAEGFPMSRGYVKPLYLLPVFQEKKVFNATQFPFKSDVYKGTCKYSKGICPVVERLYEQELTATNICQYPHSKGDIDSFMKALKKILKYKHEISKKNSL